MIKRLQNVLDGERPLEDWMTFGTSVLCNKKELAKDSEADNYRSISCLSLMWKWITGILAENMYYLERENVLLHEQKGCCKGSQGTKHELRIDKIVLKDCKRRHINIAMTWIDYEKAYDMVPHSWISECLDMFGIANNVQDF